MAFIIDKYHVHSLNCAIYFPLSGYTKYGNANKQRKNFLGGFLWDMGGKIAGSPQCHALGTTLQHVTVHFQIPCAGPYVLFLWMNKKN